MTTRIYHSDGWVEKFGPLQIFSGSTPQQAGSAITYGRRYALSAALGIAADEDNDGAETSKPKAKVETVQKKVGPGAQRWGGADSGPPPVHREGHPGRGQGSGPLCHDGYRHRAWVDLIRLGVQDAVLEDAKNWLTRQTADAEQVPLL